MAFTGGNAARRRPRLPGRAVDAFRLGSVPLAHRDAASIYFYDADHCLSQHGT